MKLEKLFNKKIKLNESKIFGGGTTSRQCQTATNVGKCTDVTTTVSDDTGKTLESCTDYNCP